VNTIRRTSTGFCQTIYSWQDSLKTFTFIVAEPVFGFHH